VPVKAVRQDGVTILDAVRGWLQDLLVVPDVGPA